MLYGLLHRHETKCPTILGLVTESNEQRGADHVKQAPWKSVAASTRIDTIEVKVLRFGDLKIAAGHQSRLMPKLQLRRPGGNAPMVSGRFGRIECYPLEERRKMI
jgi:hypothetical protein